jgi:hypothetical protein
MVRRTELDCATNYVIGASEMFKVREFFRPELVRLNVLVLGATAISLVYGTEPAVRWWATALQLAGTVVVLLQLLGALHLVDPEMMRREVRTWWRAVRGSSTIVTATGHSAMTGFGSAMSISTQSAPPGADHEMRISVLERRIETLQGEVHAAHVAIRDETTARERAMKEEAQARANEVSQVRELVGKLATGSAWQTIIGCECLVLGIALAGVLPDYAHWRGW